jgi:hypothetical protein
MTAAGNTQQQARADAERRRAVRTAKIAERHERSVGAEPFLEAFHLRMATIHRQVQRQHLAAAALHAARADLVRVWRDVAGACSQPSKSAISADQPPAPAMYEFQLALVESLEVDGDVRRFSSTFVSGCVALLSVTAAAMLIKDHQGELRIAAWSGEPARLFTAAELTGGEGPSIDCQLAGGPRAYPTTSTLATRWPRLVGTAAAADVAAVYTFPLLRRDEALGVLTLVDRRPGQLTDDVLQHVEVLTRAAAVGLAHRNSIDYYQRATAQLQSALTSRVAIEQAKGMLAERLGIPVNAAFDLLRSHARGNSRNLHEVAAEIIDRSLDIVSRSSGRTVPLARTPPPSQ